jgi:hypothetical protein
MPRKKKSNRKRLSGVRVHGQLRPEPDWDKFAYAMLRYARLLMDEEKRAKTKAKAKP